MLLLDVAKKLIAKKIRFAVAGGYAVALHGAVRGTVDLDLVTLIDKENLIALEKALNGLGLVSRIPVAAIDIFRFRKEYVEKRNLIAWSFFDPSDGSRVVDIVITHDLKDMKTKTISLHGVKVPILAKESLIAMKRAAGRPQDIEDIRALEAFDEEA